MGVRTAARELPGRGWNGSPAHGRVDGGRALPSAHEVARQTTDWLTVRPTGVWVAGPDRSIRIPWARPAHGRVGGGGCTGNPEARTRGPSHGRVGGGDTDFCHDSRSGSDPRACGWGRTLAG